jgi:drug/metabolite transporter (DMT)-like permease
MALSPPLTAGMAYIFTGEELGRRGLLGMSLVIAGICMTVFGRQNNVAVSKITIKPEGKKGYIFAFIASVGQSAGMILTKIGLGAYDPVSGTQIRVFAAIIGFALILIVFKGLGSFGKAISNKEGIKYTAIGSVFGPFLGVTLMLFAIQRASAGIVSTLIGLCPVLIIPPEIFVFKKKINAVEIAGAVTAVCGTAVFFL